MGSVNCRVSSIRQLNEEMFEVKIQPETWFAFTAGQYLRVLSPDGLSRYYSIASPPWQRSCIELHIARSVNRQQLSMVDQLHRSGFCSVSPPQGLAGFRNDQCRPLLLMAGGSGYSYIRAILLAALADSRERPIYLYWGTRTRDQLYGVAELDELKARYRRLSITLVLESPEPGWTGAAGHLLEHVMADFSDLSGFDIYIAGRPEMALSARDRFCAGRSANEQRIFSDAWNHAG
ncbi:NAD(P)H-flavin reductase [Chromobacterium vaccinii]|uniref:NAD(P)H-flavin reductase n=1 Tax=Chromobacterium vaccinii TaxID=1108595 RepID=A0ABV0F9J5_9NEIS